MILHQILAKLQAFSHYSFKREPYLDWEKELLECDCSGLITLLLLELKKEDHPLFHQFGPHPKAKDYFDFIKDHDPILRIQDLKRYDVLCWKKNSPPQKGDTGHLMILLNRPKKIGGLKWEIQVLEATKRLQKLSPQTKVVEVNHSGHIQRIQWDPNSTKVKETQILGFSFFLNEECPTCLFPKITCLCEFLPQRKFKSPPIIILRHPSEKKHPFASVPLLERCFEDLTILEGEVFSPIQGTLIFPEQQNIEVVDFKKLEVGESTPLPFILLDGTWNKVKKILHLNPWLVKLPRRELVPKEKPQYLIRKVINDKALSTLEAFSILHSIENPIEAHTIVTIFKEFNRKQAKIIT